jgi:hypothetical protein
VGHGDEDQADDVEGHRKRWFQDAEAVDEDQVADDDTEGHGKGRVPG